jgi:phage head maturation protease
VPTLVDHGVSPIVDSFVLETVRNARRMLTEDDLPKLINLLERIDNALSLGSRVICDRVVAAAPDGPIRRCLAAIVRHHAPVAERSTLGRTGTLHTSSTRRPYESLSGMCAPVNEWANSGWRWQSIDPDCFAFIDTRRFGHEPVSLLWQHRSGTTPLGLSRKWSVADDGALSGEFYVPAYPIAQMAAAMAKEGGLGLSVGVRFDSDWIHPDPSDWDPRTGTVDVCTHMNATVEEVSLTPTPMYDTTIDSVY